MPKKKLHLTVDERLLLHLSCYSIMYDEMEAPYALTQQGIADAINVLRSAVPRSIKNLEIKGWVEEQLSHVKNTSRRRKVYFLTLDGRVTVNEMIEKINEKKIVLEKENEESIPMRIKEINPALDKRYTLLEIINALSEDNVVSEKILTTPTIQLKEDEAKELPKKKEKKPSGLVDMIKTAPSARTFEGRQEELESILEDIGSDSYRAVIIQGIAGIGKTTLASKVLEELKGKKSLYWYRFHNWDTLHNALIPLGEFLAEMGRDEALQYLQGNPELNLNDISNILQKDLEGTNSVLFFDDFHTINEDIKNLFILLREALEFIEGCKMVITTRFLVKFYDRREVLVKKMIREMELSGLDMESSFRILKLRGFSEELLDAIYQKTQGHPLSLELVESASADIDLENFSIYLEEEIYSHLNENERVTMSIVSLFRYPVPKNSITLIEPQVGAGDISNLTTHSLLIQTEGHCDIHDLMRDFFSQQLNTVKRDEYNNRIAQCYLEEINTLKEELKSLTTHGSEVDMMRYNATYDDILRKIIEAQYHFIQGGNTEAALEQMVEYGQKLLSKGFAQNLQDVLLSIDHTQLTDQQLAHLCELLGDTHNRMGEWHKAFSEYEKGVNCAKKAKEAQTEARIYIKMGMLREKEEMLEDATKLLEKSLSISESIGDVRLAADATGSLGWIYWKSGDFGMASEYLQSCMEKALDHPDLPGQAKIHITNGIDFSRSGDMERSINEFDKCLEVIKRNIELDYEDSLFTRIQDNYLKAIFSHYVQSRLFSGS
jgi:tetratricopeptide (TPR) repeat protein/DNA-binding MarR family transcriptional regulator